MDRRLLIRIATPAMLLGSLLLAACLLITWQVNRLERNLTAIISQNVTSLEAAQELEIRVRQLRNHCYLYLLDPTPARLTPIEEDNQHFEQALDVAQGAAHSQRERDLVADIHKAYEQYRLELHEEVAGDKPRTGLARFADAHPIRGVTDRCHALFLLNKDEMRRTADESNWVSRQAQLWLVLLGLLGPTGGLLIGYNVARRLRQSIYKLSVRVQDMAQRLDQNVASMSVAVDGDFEHLDRQMEHVVARVEEVAERLQRHQREMLRAEQLAAVGQLAASVAHEVRNPLTSVKMLVEAARRPKNGMPLTAEDLDVIHGEVTRLEQTVQAFLDFARLPAPQMKSCDLRKVVHQAVELVKARARQQGVAIHIQAGDELGTLAEDATVPAHADAGQLCTVLVNLFLNALDAMPRGGRLEVALKNGGEAGVCLQVLDTGSGIPPDIAGRLFTPFTSSKPTGTGLGLSISKRIIEEHGGQIVGGNRPEGGAAFTITLPTVATHLATGRTYAKPQAAVRG